MFRRLLSRPATASAAALALALPGAGLALSGAAQAQPQQSQSQSQSQPAQQAQASAAERRSALPVRAAPPPPPLLARLQDGADQRLTYELRASARLFFIPVSGKARFTTDFKGRTYRMRSKVKTTGIADIFVDYDLDLSATGYVRDDGLKTYSYVSQNTDGKKNRRVELTYRPTDVDIKATPKWGDLGDPAATPAQRVEANDPVSALISFMLQKRIPGENPCGGPIRIFDGKQLTHLHLTYRGKRNVRAPAYRGEALECHVRVDRLAGYDAKDRGSNLSGVEGPIRMYLAPMENGMTPIVRMEVDSEDIGRITLEASELKWETMAPQR